MGKKYPWAAIRLPICMASAVKQITVDSSALYISSVMKYLLEWSQLSSIMHGSDISEYGEHLEKGLKCTIDVIKGHTITALKSF